MTPNSNSSLKVLYIVAYKYMRFTEIHPKIIHRKPQTFRRPPVNKHLATVRRRNSLLTGRNCRKKQAGVMGGEQRHTVEERQRLRMKTH